MCTRNQGKKPPNSESLGNREGFTMYKAEAVQTRKSPKVVATASSSVGGLLRIPAGIEHLAAVCPLSTAEHLHRFDSKEDIAHCIAS